MKRSFLLLTLFAAAGVSFGAEQAAVGADGNSGFDESKIQAMELRLVTITDPATKLFFQANIEREKGEPENALQILSKLIVHHASNEKWIARSELLSAELYLEMGMLDAADVTARQVQILHEGTDVAAKAGALRSKIEELKKEMESK